jgi:hypothetical protein
MLRPKIIGGLKASMGEAIKFKYKIGTANIIKNCR